MEIQDIQVNFQSFSNSTFDSHHSQSTPDHNMLEALPLKAGGMGKHKSVHTVEKCDEWLSTRTKRKINTTSTAGKRASLSRPLRSIGNILTQNSPPPAELKTHIKQSTLSKFLIKSKEVPEINNIEDESLESSEELPSLAGDYNIKNRSDRHPATGLLSFTGDQIHTQEKVDVDLDDEDKLDVDSDEDELNVDSDEDELPALAVIKHHISSRTLNENKINAKINIPCNTHNDKNYPLIESRNEAHTNGNSFTGQFSYYSNYDTRTAVEESNGIPREGSSDSVEIRYKTLSSHKIPSSLPDTQTEPYCESLSYAQPDSNCDVLHSGICEKLGLDDHHKPNIPQSKYVQSNLEQSDSLDIVYDLTENTEIKSASRRDKTDFIEDESVIDLDIYSNHCSDFPRKSKFQHYNSEIDNEFDIDLMTENTLKHSNGLAGRTESWNSDLGMTAEFKIPNDNSTKLPESVDTLSSDLCTTAEVKIPNDISTKLPESVDSLSSDLCMTIEVKTPTEYFEVSPQSMNSVNSDIDLSTEVTHPNHLPLSLPQSVNSLTSDLDLMTEVNEYEGNLISTQEADLELENFSIDNDSQVDT